MKGIRKSALDSKGVGEWGRRKGLSGERTNCPSSFALLSRCSCCSPASGVHNEKLLSRCYCHCL